MRAYLVLPAVSALAACGGAGDGPSCPIDCAPPPSGCRYVGEATCDPPACPQLVCDPATRPLASLDESCFDDAFTAGSILERIEPSYAVRLLTFDPATVTYGEPSAALTIDVGYDGGEILCHPPIIACDECGARDVGPSISVDVTMSLATDDGVLDDTFVATIRVEHQVGDAMPAFDASIPIGELGGTYAPVYAGEDGVALELSGWFSDASTTGAIVEALRQSGPSTRVEIVNVAMWNATAL